MPPAARVTDVTGHGPPLAPGPGSPTVLIGFLPAWRAVPAGLGSALEGPLNAMKSLMSSAQLVPPAATAQLAQIQIGLTQAAGQAAGGGNPGAVGGTVGAFTPLIATNVALTATWTAASAVPGGQPAATTAYTQGIKAAAGAAASAAVMAIAGVNDIHVCPIPVPPIPHGPGVVTKGSQTVMVNSLPLARQNDKVFEACGGADPISMGCVTVDVGDGKGSGGGGGGGGGGGSSGTSSGTAGGSTSAMGEGPDYDTQSQALSEAARSGSIVCEVCEQLSSGGGRGRGVADVGWGYGG